MPDRILVKIGFDYAVIVKQAGDSFLVLENRVNATLQVVTKRNKSEETGLFFIPKPFARARS